MPHYEEHYGLSVVIIGFICLGVAIFLFITSQIDLGIGFACISIFSFYCSFAYRDKPEPKKECEKDYSP